jgi:2,3-bisphosphoglycerate-independent phosphoglycerate mutase
MNGFSVGFNGMRVLFIFLDGIGLGENNPGINPFALVEMPNLQSLLGGCKLLAASAPYQGERASLLALDASLGVKGLPQSATGQAVLLTGVNIPQEIGYHYGPKPNPEVAKYLLNGNTLFGKITRAGKRAALLNAYPPRYFQGIQSGKRIFSSIPLAVTSAGIALLTQEDLYAGLALSADFTGQGWREMLGFPDAPVLDPHTAGVKLAELARTYDYSMFEYWASDYAGHKQNMDWAVTQLETFDGVLAGLLEHLPDDLLVLVTSDHGNMEDLSTRRHTSNPVPGLVIGSHAARDTFTENLSSLADVSPAIQKTLE